MGPLKAVNRHYLPLYINIYGYGNIEKNKEGFTFWGKDKLDNYTYIWNGFIVRRVNNGGTQSKSNLQMGIVLNNGLERKNKNFWCILLR